MKHTTSASRRLFLQQARAFSLLGAAGPMAMQLAAAGASAAGTATDYKALVCVFLQGGNDAFNTVLATDDPSWTRYTAVRNQQPDSIALLRQTSADKTQTAGSPGWLGGVLPIAPTTTQTGRTFALHPSLKQLQASFASQRAAVVANVGPLTEPLTKLDYTKGVKSKPRKLFSHNDQQSTWMAMAPEGATQGWGGKLADALASGNANSMFTAISVGGNALWVSGQVTQQYQVSNTGPIRLGTLPDAQGVSRVYGSDVVGAALERIVSSTRNQHLMSRDLAALNARSIQAERLLSGALPQASQSPYATANLNFTGLDGASQANPLAQQLQTVARMVGAQASLGLKRQVFFVNLAGFDTHNSQNSRHSDLMARLDQALASFTSTLEAMGMADKVTTFTASDFGRTFTSNGDGTDHGWGGHHFVWGRAVKGGDIHGAFPVLGRKNSSNNDFDESPDQLTNGVLLPRQSVDQYGATLGAWFGLSHGQLLDVFPNLSRFQQTNLGFMKT